MNTNKIGKNMLAVMLIILFFTLMPGLVFAAAGLEEGEYSIQVVAINETNDAPSMADKTIKKPVKLEVLSGKIYAAITMTDSEVVKDLSFKNSAGHFEPASVIGQDKTVNETTYKLPIAQLEQPITVQAYIVPMGRPVNFRLAFDPTTLMHLTGKTTGAGQNASPTQTPAGSLSVPSPKTADRAFYTSVTLLLAVLLLSGALYYMHPAKRKKAAENN